MLIIWELILLPIDHESLSIEFLRTRFDSALMHRFILNIRPINRYNWLSSFYVRKLDGLFQVGDAARIE